MQENEISMDVVAGKLVSSAHCYALKICAIESISQLESVLGSLITSSQKNLVMTVALVRVELFVAAYEYSAKKGREPDHVVIRQLEEAIVRSGTETFNNEFSRVWQLADEQLNGQEAIRRLAYDVSGDPVRLLDRAIRQCVDWAVTTLWSIGYLPSFARDETEDYKQILKLFRDFTVSAGVVCCFDKLRPQGGFSSIDLSSVPTCLDSYDVFISYRRADGDICARLLYQELKHRGFKCFLDVESVTHGAYDLQLLSALSASENFLFIKTERAFENVEDPEDHVRIELEAARHFNKNIVIVATPRVSRSIGYMRLPNSLEYLRNLRAYRLDVGEAFDFSIEQIVNVAIQTNSLNHAGEVPD